MHYHNITKDDMLNGDGLRVVLWTAGCSHGCKGCHNMVTWDVDGGLPFDEAAREEIFDELKRPYISGITFSGGDPLHPANREETGRLIEEIRKSFPGKTIWVYTGYLWEEIRDLDYIQKADIVVDGKFVEEQKDTKLHWKGSANQRVIDVKRTLEEGEVILHEPDMIGEEEKE
ncbi:anaerobic ribonucleoside-triphosphate reductase activating protein [Lachnospiraceae bacterium 62-35]